MSDMLERKIYSNGASIFSKKYLKQWRSWFTSLPPTPSQQNEDFRQLHIQNGRRCDRTRYGVAINCSKSG